VNLLKSSLALAALALTVVSTAAHADSVNLVTNGSFSTITTPGSAEFNTVSNPNAVTGWTSTGFNFVFTSPGATTAGAGNHLSLWDPSNFTASPDGGNFIALDGAFQVGAVSQTINGLVAGQATTVSFYFAGAQQSGFSGTTTEQLTVSLGDQTFATQVLTDPSHGFTGWYSESFTFTPTSTSETLSFLANGTPSGEPPMSLLDGVSVTQPEVPEPSSLLLFATGLTGLSGMVRARFSKRNQA
jgi:Protein of unknown function (DUF642)/PEP-CTERM motif